MSHAFESLSQAFQTGGLEAALQTAAAEARDQGRYHELFEILKMRSRLRLGLPLLHDEKASLSEAQQRELEDGLLAACREVGYSLLAAGQIQDGWFYLRHLSEPEEVVAALKQIEVNDENLDQVLGLLLHEGLDSARGFQLVLKHHGTCNAITGAAEHVVWA